MRQACVRGGGHACPGWVLAGVSVGGVTVGEWQLLPGLSVFPAVALQPASSFRPFCHHPGETFGSTPHSRQSTSGRTAPSSGLRLSHMTLMHSVLALTFLSLLHPWSL